MTRRSSIRSKEWALPLLVLLGCAVALILGEITVRVYYGDKFSRRPAFYGPHKGLGWAPTPGLDHTFYGSDYSIHIRTDNNGYRLGSLGEVDYTKELIILCGDSYVFGWGVSTGETFASYLDEAVAERTGGRTRVVNLGVGGYGTWQNNNRLLEFTRIYPNANVKAVIVVHCQNDAIDNLVTLGHTHGEWTTVAKPNEKSKWHLKNFFRYSRERIAQSRSNPETGEKPGGTTKDADNETEDPEFQDELWSFETESRREYPRYVEVGGERVKVSKRTKLDTSNKELLKRKTLTEIQKQLYYLANKSIHQITSELGCNVIHTYAYSTRAWYINQVDPLIERASTSGEINLGKVPVEGSYKGKVLNRHSGRHYRAEFNQFWSQKMLEQLISAGVLETSIR